MKSKIWLITTGIIVLGGLIGGVLYFSQKAGSISKLASDLQAQIDKLNTEKIDLQALVLNLQNQLNNGKQQPSQTLVYTNDKYGFTLNFPSTWAGYKVNNREVNWGPMGTADSFDFGFDAQDSIFNIGVISHAQWSAIKAQGGPIPTFINSDSDHVYVYSMSQYAANDTMATRRNEVAGIVSTFKLK